MPLPNSYEVVLSTAGMTRHNIGIAYRKRSEISVYLDTQPAPGQWSWIGNEPAIQFHPPLPANVEIAIVRRTDASQIAHEFDRRALFLAHAVDENFTQLLHLLQEALEAEEVREGLEGL